MEIYNYIFDMLSAAGIDVYAPDTHEGDVILPYVVVKETSTEKLINFSSTRTYVDILCYADVYSKCVQLKNVVKEIMKNTQMAVMPTYVETEPFYDDSIHGYMSSVEYRYNRKI